MIENYYRGEKNFNRFGSVSEKFIYFALSELSLHFRIVHHRFYMASYDAYKKYDQSSCLDRKNAQDYLGLTPASVQDLQTSILDPPSKMTFAKALKVDHLRYINS